MPSSLNAEDLAELRMRGAAPAGPPARHARPARAAAPPAGHGDRGLPHGGRPRKGTSSWPGARSKWAPELASGRVTLRLNGHLAHVIRDGILAKTIPSPVPAGDRAKLRCAQDCRCTPAPPPAPGPVSVQRKVPRDGVIMVTRQRLRVGAAHAGKIVTVYVEDTHFRVTIEGAQVSLHPRNQQRPVNRWKAKIHAPKH